MHEQIVMEIVISFVLDSTSHEDDTLEKCCRRRKYSKVNRYRCDKRWISAEHIAY